MATIAEQLAEWSCALEFETIPKPVVRELELHSLDTIGVLLSASKLEYARNQAIRAVAEAGSEEATLFGDGHKIATRNAIFLNACLGHGIDWDDTHVNALLHPTATVLPAVLAIAEAKNMSGQELFVGLAAGMETMVRIGLAAGRGLVNGCLHPTSMCGTFGVAVAVARMFNLDQKQTVNALGIAGGMCAGLHESTIDGSLNKCVHSGIAAQAGYAAVELARAGFTGPATIFEGPKGFLNAFTGAGNFDADVITDQLGSYWNIGDLAYKAYACCQGAHPSADTALMLYHQHGVRGAEVENIIVRVGKIMRSLCEPAEVKRRPPSAYGAKFSIPFVIASALTDGEVVLDSFSARNISDPDRLALAALVEHVVDPYYDVGSALRGHISVRMKDGREFTAETDACTGSPQNPWPYQGIVAKFRLLAEPVIGKEQVNQLIPIVDRLHELDTVDAVTSLICQHQTSVAQGG